MNLYEYIKGKVVGIKEDYVVLDNNRIGYKIFTTKNSLTNIQVNEMRTMYIYFNLREDGVYLYGFTTEEELEMFNMLLLVSKIGPKVSLSALSTLSTNQIKLAVLNNDTDILCNVPGIGKKTASRIILELKDRIDDNDIVDDIPYVENNKVETAIHGLMSLSYTRGEIVRVLAKMDTSIMETEEIMKEVLKRLSKQ